MAQRSNDERPVANTLRPIEVYFTEKIFVFFWNGVRHVVIRSTFEKVINLPENSSHEMSYNQKRSNWSWEIVSEPGLGFS